MNLNSIKQVAGKASIKLQKHSPELLIFGGVVGMLACTVMACKATKDLDDTVTKNKIDIEKTKEDFQDHPSYKREVTFAYGRAAGRLLKLYSGPIVIGTVSATAILSGHNIMKKRNLAMAAAYSAVEEGFNRYRQRVISELGDEADRRFRFGAKDEEIEVVEVDDKGKDKKKKVKGENISSADCSPYARFFDMGSVKWTKDPSSNLFVLRQMERYANERLQAKGHLFLNEVYDMLDIPRTQDGSVVGWVLGNGDDYVDFGLYDLKNEAKRRFVNGDEAVILLDFNVDGLIYNLI